MESLKTDSSVSLIIPARNEGEPLRGMLEAISRQLQHHDAEIIVLDDQSLAPLTEVIPLLSCQSLNGVRIQVIRSEARLGSAKAKNLGAKHAKNSWLLFLDAHVTFTDGSLESLFAAARDCPRAILGAAIANCSVLSDFLSLCSATRATQPAQYYGWQLRLTPRPRLTPNKHKPSDTPFKVPSVGATSMLISKEVFEQLGCFESELTGSGNTEDAELCLRGWCYNVPTIVVPTAVCVHYDDPIKTAFKKAAPESPYKIPWYDDCEENAFRFSYLHLPDSIHDQYFATDSNGRKLCSVCLTSELMQRRARLDAQRGIRREHFMRLIEQLADSLDSNGSLDNVAIFVEDSPQAYLERRFHNQPLFLTDQQLLERLTGEGLENVTYANSPSFSSYDELYRFYRPAIEVELGVAASWQESFHLDIAVQEAAPWLHLADCLSTLAKEQGVSRIISESSDARTVSAVAMSNRYLTEGR